MLFRFFEQADAACSRTATVPRPLAGQRNRWLRLRRRESIFKAGSRPDATLISYWPVVWPGLGEGAVAPAMGHFMIAAMFTACIGRLIRQRRNEHGFRSKMFANVCFIHFRPLVEAKSFGSTLEQSEFCSRFRSVGAPSPISNPPLCRLFPG